MDRSPFESFAERHGLDYAESIAPVGGGIPDGVSEVAGGSLPGGIDGIVSRYAKSPSPTRAKPPVAEPNRNRLEGVEDFCLVATRVPESATFLPYVTCRDEQVRGMADRLIGPGGLIPIVDDGAGFDVTSRNGSAGLQNMSDRIGALGGELTVESSPDAGTNITGVVPISG